MKHTYVLAILAIIVMFAGCTPSDEGSSESTKMFAGGTEGLVLGFLEGSPPPEIFDQGQYPFDIEVKVENAGEWDVPANEVMVSISGIDPAEFGLTEYEKMPDEDLPGVELDSQGNEIPGHITYVSFSPLEYSGSVTGRVTFPVRADVCYTYGTTAQAKLCMKADMLDYDDSVCNVNEVKAVENSGSPIHVVSMSQEPMGADKLAFTFKIQARGVGAISRFGSSCSNELGFEDEVWVEVDTGNSELSCAGLKEGNGATTGYVKLNNGYRVVTCKQPVSTTVDFEKLATIRLKFDYKEHIDTTLMVKHSG